ncbi:anthranilate synthase component I [Pelagicoccus sp. SDUM812002]|uniref:anthranilate synthase component I n=1 Tax=Pelagicoccus sp. SDUM812002 TaxID=3041266 RepID=UPI00280DFAB5|nr:anthranilate synthase component I [Pelagicoccus sp. SDUM812002]MDQ8184138.1 anthranilate synthase component I [Pelagicoccus sp. SDUM812002]
MAHQLHPNIDLETFESLAQNGNVIPVYADLMADLETPLTAYSKLKTDGPAFLLESIEGGERLSRYTFIACRPRKVFTCYWDKTIIEESGQSTREIETPQDPLTLIEEEIAEHHPVEMPELAPFTGGAVGYVSYEYISRIETVVPIARNNCHGSPLAYYMMADSIVIFDRAKQTMRLLVNARLEGKANSAEAYQAALEELDHLKTRLEGQCNLTPATLTPPEALKVPQGNFLKQDFEDMVERTKEYIRSGDIIQVVLSQRFEKDFEKSPLDLYRALRNVNPSPYMFLLETDDFAIVGASPEVHVRLTGDKVEIRPIAGTRHRGKTEEQDLALEEELLADEKEKAEHLMLVDLARNDIGRVCKYGSVEVPDYMIVERYSHVMHIVSQVEGQIASDKNAFDLMRATFPAGTVSGAPKIRAMQIISENEPDQREFYSGALGYFSYNGNLDSCITLRTAMVKDGKVIIQSGAGIVADSIPESEYQETIFKASALFKAVGLAEAFQG